MRYGKLSGRLRNFQIWGKIWQAAFVACQTILAASLRNQTDQDDEPICILPRRASRVAFWLVFGSSTALLTVRSVLADPPPAVESIATTTLEVAGKTQPAHGRQATITSIVLHPIIAVFVAPGDRVKAGQKLIEMDRDEPEAEVRARKADVAELEASLARIKAIPHEERAKAKAELEAAGATAAGAREQLNA